MIAVILKSIFCQVFFTCNSIDNNYILVATHPINSSVYRAGSYLLGLGVAPALSTELFVMGYNKKYDTYRPTDKEWVDKMKGYQKEQKEKSKVSKTENWFYYKHQKEFTKRTGIKISRQVKRGTRIFDFWCHEKGIAIEIDGGYHTENWKLDKDSKYDFYNLNKHGILVIRIDNRDDIGAIDALRKVELSESWRLRKHSLGILGCIEKKQHKDKTFMDYIDELSF